MIRIVVIDDHPALRAGLETVLRSEPGLVPVGSAERAEEVWPLLNRTRPDVVLLDYHLPGHDGLQLCRRIKADALAPQVLLYSAYAGGTLALPAALAGADGVIGKGIPALELFEAVRRVARGERVMPPIPREHRDEARGQLDPEDLPLLEQLLDERPMTEIERDLGIDRGALLARIDGMIARLRVEVPEVRTA
jgi:DNA-binding NarL/FixJ family response regulator